MACDCFGLLAFVMLFMVVALFGFSCLLVPIVYWLRVVIVVCLMRLLLLLGCVIVLLVCSYGYGVWFVYGRCLGAAGVADDDPFVRWRLANCCVAVYVWVYLCFWWVFVLGVVVWCAGWVWWVAVCWL